jgi:5-methylcytosine-specific restriction endonuclease McrA
MHIRREMLELGAWVEDVPRLEVFERDGWICQLCTEPVDRDLVIPDLLAASLDHVIPLARGGEHSRANAQLAHFLCNSTKGASHDVDGG